MTWGMYPSFQIEEGRGSYTEPSCKIDRRPIIIAGSHVRTLCGSLFLRLFASAICLSNARSRANSFSEGTYCCQFIVLPFSPACHSTVSLLHSALDIVELHLLIMESRLTSCPLRRSCIAACMALRIGGLANQSGLHPDSRKASKTGGYWAIAENTAHSAA